MDVRDPTNVPRPVQLCVIEAAANARPRGHAAKLQITVPERRQMQKIMSWHAQAQTSTPPYTGVHLKNQRAGVPDTYQVRRTTRQADTGTPPYTGVHQKYQDTFSSVSRRYIIGISSVPYRYRQNRLPLLPLSFIPLLIGGHVRPLRLGRRRQFLDRIVDPFPGAVADLAILPCATACLGKNT